MKNLIKISGISAALLAAMSAHAVTFAFQTEGEYTETGVGSLTSNEAGADYRSGHSAGLTVESVSYNFVESNPGAVAFPGSTITVGTGTITGKYLGIGYVLNFEMMDGAVFRSSKKTLKRSYASNIIDFSISGSALDGYTGSGSIGGTLLGSKDIMSGISKTSFDLDAAPVPEPASMAALGLGLAGIAARRKRK